MSYFIAEEPVSTQLMAVAASPRGDLLATSCKATSAEHAVIRVYDTTTWKQVGAPLPGHNLTIARIRFSNSGNFVLSCSRDRTWRLFKRNEEGEGERFIADTSKASCLINVVVRLCAGCCGSIAF
jgi:WD40 repeat protein